MCYAIIISEDIEWMKDWGDPVFCLFTIHSYHKFQNKEKISWQERKILSSL